MNTISIWGDVIDNIENFRNPNYKGVLSNDYYLEVNYGIHKIQLWEDYFLQWNKIYLENQQKTKVEVKDTRQILSLEKEL
jgi:hypothetical protein